MFNYYLGDNIDQNIRNEIMELLERNKSGASWPRLVKAAVRNE